MKVSEITPADDCVAENSVGFYLHRHLKTHNDSIGKDAALTPLYFALSFLTDNLVAVKRGPDHFEPSCGPLQTFTAEKGAKGM